MSKDDVRRALESLDDDEVRAQFEGGDFSSLGDHDLSDHEKVLVSDAAADLPDVAGFAAGHLLGTAFKTSDIGGIGMQKFQSVKLKTAMDYAGIMLGW